MVMAKTLREWLKKEYGNESYYGEVRHYASRTFKNLTPQAKSKIRKYVKEDIWGK